MVPQCPDIKQSTFKGPQEGEASRTAVVTPSPGSLWALLTWMMVTQRTQPECRRAPHVLVLALALVTFLV